MALRRRPAETYRLRDLESFGKRQSKREQHLATVSYVMTEDGRTLTPENKVDCEILSSWKLLHQVVRRVLRDEIADIKQGD